MQLPDIAKALCAAFCVKEAMRKAVGRPYSFTDCEFFPNRRIGGGKLVLSRRFFPAGRGAVPTVKLCTPAQGHVTAIVHLMAEA